jgi:iron-sulfur cluster assembly accessory protein
MTTATQIDTRLTPAAAAFIGRFLRFATGPKAGFQLKVTPGGCSGFATEFDLVASPRAGNLLWEFEGLRIFLDPASCKVLEGATLDFMETLAHTGFVVRTPGATQTACDSSANLVSIHSLMRG